MTRTKGASSFDRFPERRDKDKEDERKEDPADPIHHDHLKTCLLAMLAIFIISKALSFGTSSFIISPGPCSSSCAHADKRTSPLTFSV